MSVLRNAMNALCGPSGPVAQELHQVLSDAGVHLNLFVAEPNGNERRLIAACRAAALQGYVLTDANGRLMGRLVPQSREPSSSTACP
jgi:hypothetical protein